MSRLEISGVRGFYGARSVNLDLSRPDGSLAGWTVLAGRNGSGKSTMLQALGLVLAGPRSTGFVPSLADWMSHDVSTADIRATLQISHGDHYQPTLDAALSDPSVWMHFTRAPESGRHQTEEPLEPEFTGEGLDSVARVRGTDSVRSRPSGWFYVGYGPFRHLGRMGAGSWRQRRPPLPTSVRQVASLFDESLSLVDAVDWLVEQRLLEYEGRPSAPRLIEIVTTLLNDGLLPDGFRVSKITSEGLWVARENAEFPLREMSDGYRAITALVVDIVRQMHGAYRGRLRLTRRAGVPVLPHPGVVLVDEIDAHLHVSWQKRIGYWLKSHFPEIQFIVTTHSPYICQNADPGGLILLPGPGEGKPPRIIDQDLYERIIYGSGDDAVLSVLFGVDSPYSAEAEMLRQRLGELESKILDGTASASDKDEYRKLSETLTSSPGTRVDEIAARFGRER